MLKILKKESTFGKDFSVTIINSIGLILSVFFLNGYIARTHGLDVLGDYLFIRRTVFSAVSVLLIGMNLGLPYFIAKGGDNTYGKSGLILFFIFTVPLSIVTIFLLKINMDSIFTVCMTYSVLVYVIGATFMNLSIGLYRGHLNIFGSSIINFIGSAIIPILFFFIFKELFLILFIIGVLTIVLSFGLFIYRENIFNSKLINYNEIKNLLNYGIKRIVSFISQFFLLAGIPILLYNQISKSSIAYLNSSISLIRLLLIVIGPFGFIVLPRISKAIETSKNSTIIKHISTISNFSIFVGILFSGFLFIFGPNLLEFWLGKISSEGTLIIQIISLSIPFFIISNILRSIIDAGSDKGYNSIIYSVSTVFLIISYLIMKHFNIDLIMSGIWAFNIGYIFAGILSIIVLNIIFKNKIRLVDSINTSISQIFIVFLISIAINKISDNTIIQLITFITLVCIYIIIYILISRKDWTLVLKRKIKRLG